MQRQVIIEFGDEYAALARQHANLLRDANEASARNRKVLELLEGYRAGYADQYDRVAALVSGDNGEKSTPTGRMVFDFKRGWTYRE